MYVIVRNDGCYVAKPGRRSSYTCFLQHARVFSTRQDAEKERCPDNEHIESLEDILRLS